MKVDKLTLCGLILATYSATVKPKKSERRYVLKIIWPGIKSEIQMAPCLSEENFIGECTTFHRCQGMPGGICAFGFGVCCINVINSNDDATEISENNTYLLKKSGEAFLPFVAIHRPKSWKVIIAGVRLDFINLNLNSMNNSSKHFIKVVNEPMKYPHINDTLNGEHMFIRFISNVIKIEFNVLLESDFAIKISYFDDAGDGSTIYCLQLKTDDKMKASLVKKYSKCDVTNEAIEQRKTPAKPKVKPNSIPWCQGPSLKLLEHPGPVTGLFSIPGSGNTWARDLLQKATGIMTGSVYGSFKSGGYAENKFPGERIDDGSVLVVKSHLFNNEWESFDRAIVIVRHPLHAYLAESNRVLSGDNQTGHGSYETFKNSSFASQAPRFLDYWLAMHEDLHDFFEKPMHILLYENLKKSTVQEVKNCMQFLGLEMSPAIEHCIANDKEAKFKRKSMGKEETDRIYGLLPTDLIQKFDRTYQLVLNLFEITEIH